MIKNILIGSDPEVMLTRDGNLFPSFMAKIPGTKKKPHPIGESCHVQVDNVMAEFCVPPTDNPENMFNAIQYCIKHIEDRYKVKVKPGSSGIYNLKHLSHPIAQAFGCDPDYNAWTLDENFPPTCKIKGLRSAGAHIHISYEKPNYKDSLDLIKALDVFVGLPSVLQDDDTQRRKLYGKAGAYRFKKYGVEYRTPGNYWIFKLDLVKEIFEQVQRAIASVNSGKVFSVEEGKIIQRCINSSNKELAIELITKYHNLALVPIKDDRVSEELTA